MASASAAAMGRTCKWRPASSSATPVIPVFTLSARPKRRRSFSSASEAACTPATPPPGPCRPQRPGLRACSGQQHTLTRGPPQFARKGARHKARLLEQLAVAHQSVAGELQFVRIGALGPLLHRSRGLHHAFALEHSVRALIIQRIQRRVHLAAHGIRSNAHQTARARLPSGPCTGVERRSPHQGHVCTAGKTLCGGNADAHAGKGTRPAAHEEPTHVGHGHTGLIKGLTHRLDELNVARLRHKRSREERTSTEAREGLSSKKTSGVHHATAQESMSVEVSIATISVRSSSSFISLAPSVQDSIGDRYKLTQGGTGTN